MPIHDWTRADAGIFHAEQTVEKCTGSLVFAVTACGFVAHTYRHPPRSARRVGRSTSYSDRVQECTVFEHYRLQSVLVTDQS
jgi:hypothetical protein